MDIITLAKSAHSLHKLTKDDIFDVLNKAELSAAAEAIRKSTFAKDPRGSIYSAISHLEVAEALCLEKIKSKDGYDVAGLFFMSNDMAFRAHEIRHYSFTLFHIYSVMGIFYYGLGEIRLADNILCKLVDAMNAWEKFRLQVDWTPGHYMNPKNWKFINRELPITPEQLDEFQDIAKNWNWTVSE